MKKNQKTILLFIVMLGAVLSLVGCPKPSNPSCKNDAQCLVKVDGKEMQHSCVQGKCLECGSDTDCSVGSRCVDNSCSTMCVSNSDCKLGSACNAGQCQSSTNNCVEDSDCLDHSYCKNSKCVSKNLDHVHANLEKTPCDFKKLKVFFDFDQSVIKAQSIPALEKLYACAADNNTKIVIEGHTDNVGTVAYNLSLGEKRAKSISNYLEKLGLSQNRISVVSYGEEKPLVGGNGEEARAKNRRGEIKLY